VLILVGFRAFIATTKEKLLPFYSYINVRRPTAETWSFQGGLSLDRITYLPAILVDTPSCITVPRNATTT